MLRLIRASFTASHGIYGAPRVFLDLREAGALSSAIRAALAREDTGELRARRHHSVRQRFGWPALLPSYVSMLARGVVPTPARPFRVEVAGEFAQ